MHAYTNRAAKVSPENTSFGYFLRLISILAEEKVHIRTIEIKRKDLKFLFFLDLIERSDVAGTHDIMANVKSRQRFFFAVQFLRNRNVIGHDNGNFFPPFNEREKNNQPF